MKIIKKRARKIFMKVTDFILQLNKLCCIVFCISSNMTLINASSIVDFTSSQNTGSKDQLFFPALEMERETIEAIYESLMIPPREDNHLKAKLIVVPSTSVSFEESYISKLYSCINRHKKDKLKELDYLPNVFLSSKNYDAVEDAFKKMDVKIKDWKGEYLFVGDNERGNCAYYLAAKLVQYRKNNNKPLLQNQIKIITFFSNNQIHLV
ncbi:MAG: hypothetical protein FADNKDHG_01399 [Holosporales bacterium]